MSAETKQQVLMLDLKKGVPREEQRSRFTGYCAKVMSLEEVKLAYMKVRKLDQRADHIMLAYRIKTEEGVKQGSVHNGEVFGDLEIMKVLIFQERVNIVVLVSRLYGGVHLGRLRLQMIKGITEEMITQIPAEIFAVPKYQRSGSRRGRGRGHGQGRGRGFRGRGENMSRGSYRGWNPRGRVRGDPQW